jgi:hypothetical protein
MAVRSLARFYYYIVFIAMLVLAAVGIGFVLNTLLALTPLAGDQPRPDSATITRSILFAGVAWLIAGILGGAHYWLIRRDLETDPSAGPGGIRSFFLNAAQFFAIWIGVPLIGGAIQNIGGQYSSYFVIPTLSIGIAALFVGVVVHLERIRTAPGQGAPIIFQRLHIYQLQLIILGYFASTTVGALSGLLHLIFVGNQNCDQFTSFDPYCYVSYNAPGQWTAVLFIGVAFALYWLLSSSDNGSAIRQVYQLLGFFNAIAYVLVGLFGLIYLGTRSALGDPFQLVQFAQGYVLPILVVGLLIGSFYLWWLRSERGASRMGAETTDHSIIAIIAFEAAVPFWFGIGFAIWRLLEIASGLSVAAIDWAIPISLILTGVVYIPISLYLRVLTARTDAIGPRRALVLALLAGGIIAGAIGAATALFAFGSQALGAPISSWEDVTRVGVAIFLVGLAIAGIYFWSARSEHLLQARPSAAPAPTAEGAPQPALSVEQILDDFAAGRLSRDEAASRIRAAART